MQEAEEDIRSTGIVVIIRGQFTLAEILPIVEILVEAQLRIVEITLNSLDALRLIRELRQKFGSHARIGAGTVRTINDVARAVDAGAEFLICPSLSLPVVEAAQTQDMLVIPGVMTPSEAQVALEAGCHLQKLFPSEAVGGVNYLKAIRAPLDDIEFIPTGGVSEKNIAQYRQAGAVAVALGSSLISKGVPIEEITRRGREYYRLWHTEPVSVPLE